MNRPLDNSTDVNVCVGGCRSSIFMLSTCDFPYAVTKSLQHSTGYTPSPTAHRLIQITNTTVVKYEPLFPCQLGSNSRILCSIIICPPTLKHTREGTFYYNANFSTSDFLFHSTPFLYLLISYIYIFLLSTIHFPSEQWCYKSVLLGIQRHTSSITLASPNNSS